MFRRLTRERMQSRDHFMRLAESSAFVLRFTNGAQKTQNGWWSDLAEGSPSNLCIFYGNTAAQWYQQYLLTYLLFIYTIYVNVLTLTLTKSLVFMKTTWLLQQIKCDDHSCRSPLLCCWLTVTESRRFMIPDSGHTEQVLEIGLLPYRCLVRQKLRPHRLIR